MERLNDVAKVPRIFHARNAHLAVFTPFRLPLVIGFNEDVRDWEEYVDLIGAAIEAGTGVFVTRPGKRGSDAPADAITDPRGAHGSYIYSACDGLAWRQGTNKGNK